MFCFILCQFFLPSFHVSLQFPYSRVMFWHNVKYYGSNRKLQPLWLLNIIDTFETNFIEDNYCLNDKNDTPLRLQVNFFQCWEIAVLDT